MLVQCWPTVCDAGPTFNQHQNNVNCLPGEFSERFLFVPNMSDRYGRGQKTKIYHKENSSVVMYLITYCLQVPEYLSTAEYMTCRLFCPEIHVTEQRMLSLHHVHRNYWGASIPWFGVEIFVVVTCFCCLCLIFSTIRIIAVIFINILTAGAEYIFLAH